MLVTYSLTQKKGRPEVTCQRDFWASPFPIPLKAILPHNVSFSRYEGESEDVQGAPVGYLFFKQ
jgi:hypothetical protein